jgi:uncharacterized membrane protein
VNPFDLKAALLEKHAQHVVLIHFPIALFMASFAFDLLARWRRLALLAGMVLARRRRHRAHAWCQSTVVLLNLVAIGLTMAPSFRAFCAVVRLCATDAVCAISFQ